MRRRDRTKGHPAALQRHQFALSIPRSIAVVTKRQITLMLRDTALTRGRFMQVLLCHQLLSLACNSLAIVTSVVGHAYEINCQVAYL